MSLIDADPALAAAIDELLAEPALAETDLSHDPDDLALPRHRPAKRGLEVLHLLRATDEAGEAAGPREVETRPHGTGPLERVGTDRLPAPAELELTQILELEETHHHVGGPLRDVDLACLRDLLDPRGQSHGVTLCGVVHPEVVADLSDHDVSGVHTHSNGEVQAALATELTRVLAKPLGQVERCVAGTTRVVLVRDRRTEQRHDPIARELVDRPLEPVDTLGEDQEEPIQDVVPLLRVDRLGELHRALHVGEQNRDLLTLPLESAAGREDLLGEVLGCVRGWARRRSIRRGRAKRLKAPSATTTEGVVGRVLPLASCTDQPASSLDEARLSRV